jgi:hypothetical protein
MRYILIFVLVATAIMVFIFADHFPRVLAHYPILQEANWTVRAWLGMDSPRSSSMSERKLRETEKILQKESPKEKEVSEEDLAEYYD